MSNEVRRVLKPGKQMLSFLLVLFILTLGIGVGTLITYRVGAVGPGDSQLKIQTDGKPLVGGGVLMLSQAFEEVAKLAEPAVVNINTEEVVKVRQRRNAPGQDKEEDPFGDLIPRFFNFPEQYKRTSLGSGVIVDPKGYIITNYHVVEGGTKIRVDLKGSEGYTAKIIAGDPLSDIAVIKIEGNKDFPYARIGNSKVTRVGDWVLAIGSPFGLDQTVTAGIISATGRVFPPSTNMPGTLFNDYLQTDAAINRGNSGGPLVNMNGEVVGINTFISTTSGASAGVGFAVPSHIFVNVYNQILNKGKVTRGWLGVNMNAVPNVPSFTPPMAKFFGVRQGKGVLITGLSDEVGNPSETGPAARAGIKSEDVIVEFEGKKIFDVPDLRMVVANTPPGKKVRVKVVRYGAEKEFEVTIAERKLEEKDQEKESFSFEEREEAPKPEIGIKFDEVPQRLAQSINEPGGALVTEVKPGSLAEEAGLIGQEREAADIIVAANGKKIVLPRDLFKTISELKSGEAAVLKCVRVRPTPRGANTSVFYTSITKP